MCGTNPLKVKSKIKTKTCDLADAHTVKVEEKPVFIKNGMKHLNSAVALASSNSKSEKATPNKSEDNRYTLDR